MLDIPGYRVVSTIRTTGSNALFQAVREVDGLAVVIKTPLESSPSPRERERYRREFSILRRLQDVRGVARPYAHERLGERPFLLLEAVPGQSLSQSVGEPLEIARFLELALSLASTLAEIHHHNVIHKDIKPSNIIVEPSGQGRLIDFGAATLQKVEHLDAAPTHLVEGTLAYMSPEQTGRMNRVVDYRTDFYSLGVTFYELLTGKRPLHGRDALEWFHAHMAQRPRPPHELNPGIPLALSALVMKLMAKVAEERYQSAEGLRADLERCREALSQRELEPFELGLRDTPQRFQLPHRLYGREAPITALLQSFERVARTGASELCLISGYSGIGKSSVVQELHKPVLLRRGFFLSGKFDQFQRDIPYATLAQAIRGLVQQLLAGTEEELARWRERLNQAWEGNGQALVALVPQLEVLVGAQPALQLLQGAEAQQRLYRVVRQFLGVFATAEHPLVVFLDDLQWADLPSLRLIAWMVSQPGALPVLWLGAYRDNEVSSSHPLTSILEELRRSGAPLVELPLEPLGLEHVGQLVADALPGADPEVVTPLAEVVRQKTGGNPFFLLQFLETLSQDGLLLRAPGRGWRWDAEGVRARAYSDNVVDFMVSRLRLYPAETQHLLRLAACVGNVFSLPLLTALSGRAEVGEVEHGLEPTLEEGMLVRVGLEQYRFLHDRIQQAAQALTPEQERKELHLRIGRLMLERLSPAQVRESLFDVVGQLNAGAERLEAPAERLQAARLNAEAGAKAEAAVAHHPAITYFTAAFELIPGDPWQTEYALAFQVRLATARCELMSGNAVRARQVAQQARSHARTRADLATAWCLESDCCYATGDVQGAVTCVLEVLAQLGMPIPQHPTWEEAAAAHAEAWQLLGARSIESLIELPRMTDPDVQVTLGALSALFTKAYVTDNRLLIICLSRIFSLTLRHGFTETAVMGCGWFGVLTGAFFKRYKEGYALGLLACAFVERYELAPYRASALLGLTCNSYASQPLAAAQELCLSGFQHGVQSGDFYSASFCCSSLIINRLAMGHNLDDIHQESLSRGEFLRKHGILDVQDQFLSYQRLVQQLRGRSRSFSTWDGDGFDEQAFEATLTPERMSSTRAVYWANKCRSRFLCGAYPEAREAGDKAMELLWSLIGSFCRELHLYRALTLAACFEEATGAEQQRFLEDMGGHQRQLAEWAAQCPETYLAAERMVAAELARVEGRVDAAARAYEEAMNAARASGAIQYVAQACELAARFWRARGVKSVAHTFAGEARAAYLQWRALGKVQQLETQWPHLAAAAATASPEDPLTSSTDSTRIDVLTVVKAQQAISGEILLERLVTALMKAAIENAGAQRGALLLPSGDTLSVVATSEGSPDSLAIPPGQDAAQQLPWAILHYVRRTREHVLIGDAAQPHPFSSDEYLARGGARSVLCLPLLRQEQFSGALYLENGLTTHAFNPARLSLLRHIASQAAISIENARLYADVQRGRAELSKANDELERRVEERTRELMLAQSRLVDTAREVGMAEVASNVLHNVGNVLTSAVVSLQMMQATLSSARPGRLKQATALLLEHREHLPEFLAPGARGHPLPDFLAGLADEVTRVQGDLREEVTALGRHIEHIRAIVEVQQTYAKRSLLAEECDLAQLVEDALRIQLQALQRHGISPRRELAAVPRVTVDKHKVLQILINLISNAKYALHERPPGQRDLWVRMAVDGQWVRIQVVDAGVGIAPEVRAQLFSHGFTTRKDGHGFGLHSSALAAKLLGGRLTLESEGPGRGTTATLELPLTPTHPGEAR